MTDKPSDWQALISGQWHGAPAVYEPDGTYVGFNIVSRASEHVGDKTRYWMETDFDAVGPLRNRFEIGRFDFGVIDSDEDRIYTGPDFVGSGNPYGNLVDSEYFSPAWNTHLRTVNHVVPELEMQVYSSLLYEGPTLAAVFNGLYIVTQDDEPASRNGWPIGCNASAARASVHSCCRPSTPAAGRARWRCTTRGSDRLASTKWPSTTRRSTSPAPT